MLPRNTFQETLKAYLLYILYSSAYLLHPICKVPGGILENKYQTKMELLPHSQTTTLLHSDGKLGPWGKWERRDNQGLFVLATKNGIRGPGQARQDSN